MRIAAAVLAGSLPLLAGGCVSLLHSTQPLQQEYVLTAPLPSSAAESAPGTAAAATLQVLPLLAGAGLGTDGIAVMRPGQRLDYYSGARWAAPAPAMLQTLAIQALRGQGRFALIEPDGGPFDAHYVLNLELTHFEADYAGAGPPTVRVALVCTLGRRATRRVVATFTASSAVTADADRMQAVVAAFERATGAALAQLAAQLVPPAEAAPAAPAAVSP
ncbi:MAG TPA: ABC-type transport auxiliary lipoprotein family protein [Steroidobacteraceae bacterium]|jgi:cholesterol transport system auxiliary component|nr:ABC-type transport auxiliary lipoprotein family protein [Steroidobacteraceae bacterium]